MCARHLTSPPNALQPVAARLSALHPVGHVTHVTHGSHVGLLRPVDQAGGNDRAGGLGLASRILRRTHEDRLQVVVSVGDTTNRCGPVILLYLGA